MTGLQRALLAAVAIAVGGFTAHAQSWELLSGLHAGDRIRVLETSGMEHKGRFTAATATAVSLDTGRGQVSVERTRVRRVKVRSTGRRVRNLLIGAGIGAAIGITLDNTLGVYIRNESAQSDAARAITYLAPIGIFAGIGAALPGYRTIYRAP
jgi:hypothetical protein